MIDDTPTTTLDAAVQYVEQLAAEATAHRQAAEIARVEAEQAAARGDRPTESRGAI
ncbi:hypothetical protein AB0O03_28785 [Streptomyces diastaticus]|uniref:hypothetical protein n=1 Tax=Streptomyces diastaticus TaxID=1956 RepID=UPI003435C7E3